MTAIEPELLIKGPDSLIVPSQAIVGSRILPESEIKQGAYRVSIRDATEGNRRNRQNGAPVLKKRLNLIHGTLDVFGQTLTRLHRDEMRMTLPCSVGQRYSKMYRLKRYRYTIFEKKIE